MRLRLPHPTRGLNCFAWLTTEIWACSKVLSPLPASACADVIKVTLDCKITNGRMSVGRPKRICAVEKTKHKSTQKRRSHWLQPWGRKHNLQDYFSVCFSKDADASDRQTKASLFIVIKEIIIITTKGWDFKNIKKKSGVC